MTERSASRPSRSANGRSAEPSALQQLLDVEHAAAQRLEAAATEAERIIAAARAAADAADAQAASALQQELAELRDAAAHDLADAIAGVEADAARTAARYATADAGPVAEGLIAIAIAATEVPTS